MCFVLVAFRVQAGQPLVIAANRDEYFKRPAKAAHWWPTHPSILAGRDEAAGGTWFGVRRDGRFAVVTNRRAPAPPAGGVRSRGELVVRVLSHDGSWADLGHELVANAGEYAAYNLLYGDPATLFVHDNYRRGNERLEPGIYALSNAFLNTPWPKVESGRGRFSEILSTGGTNDEALFALLRDERVFPEETLPDTGIGAARERALSAIFIDDGDYGTRCSTIFRVSDLGCAHFLERSHAGVRRGGDEAAFSFELQNISDADSVNHDLTI